MRKRAEIQLRWVSAPRSTTHFYLFLLFSYPLLYKYFLLSWVDGAIALEEYISTENIARRPSPYWASLSLFGDVTMTHRKWERIVSWKQDEKAVMERGEREEWLATSLIQ